MSDETLIPIAVPPLITLLVNAEREKRAPLTREEVNFVRDRAICIMLPLSKAARLQESRGFDDIALDQAWDQWQIVRQHLAPAPEQPAPEPSGPRRGRYRFLSAEAAIDDLPQDPKERHEAFIDIFGRQVFSLRNEVLEKTREIIEAPQEVRDKMGSIYSKEYTAIAKLPADAQTAAQNLARKAIDSFIRQLLLLLSHNGLSVEIAFGDDHAIAFELLLKVLRKDTLESVEEHAMNRDGEKVFYEYYGRWLNRHRDA